MNLKKNFKIGSKFIGDDQKCLIIAEISANHNNNFGTIKRLINSAKKNGADLIKIQTYTADTLTIKSNKKDFQIKRKNPWSKNKYLWNLYRKAETSKKLTSKIALATIYNTVHAFKTAGHLSEVEVRGNKTYFDTNVSNHHHFYDSENSELIDIDANEIVIQKIPKAPNGKKIKNVEVFINLKN